MELRVSHYFLAVAREESISAAAEALHLSQPTLSRQLMDLEKELGKRLFLRGNRKVTLTEEGLLLRKRASEIVELVEKTECELRKDEEIPAGDIYIGCCESEGMRIIAQAARALQRTCPQIRYQLFSGNAQDLSDRLEKGLLDFTVMTEPGELGQKYDVIRLPHRDRWTVLLRQDSPLAQKAVIRPEDLRDKPLILSRSHQLDREGLASWLRCDPNALHIAATYNLLYNASLLVSEGVGYAICFQNLINICGNSNLCYRPMEPALEMGLYLVRKKYQVFSRAAERFLQVLQQQIGLQDGQAAE